jgi:hypothetical protein
MISQLPAALLVRGLNTAYRASLRPAWRRFVAAAQDPEAAQHGRLQALLRRSRLTAFGRDHALDRVQTLADYQDAVPVRGYDELEPWLERVWRGEPGVLTPEPPVAFERSSGSTRASKRLPYTQPLLDEYAAATSPWLYDLLESRPALIGSTSYWSISPVTRRDQVSPGGVPVGLQDDVEYFPRAIRPLIRRLLPVPALVSELASVDACRYASLLHLLADPQLGLISVWSPSFLTLLLEQAVREADRLAHDLARGTLSLRGPLPAGLRPPAADPLRASRVRAALRSPGRPRLEAIWPRLALVSCWTDAAAARLVPAMQALLPPGVELQGKGLMSTEGAVSFPLLGQEGGVLAVGSHLLELERLDDPGARPVLPHEAETGGRYAPLLSTGGGLYRYRLGDAVEVVGWSYAAPRVRFLGRLDGVSDLAGEKLSPGRVGAVLDAVLPRHLEARFALLAPQPGDLPRYVLYLETAATDEALQRAAAEVEAELARGHHYGYCRELGQLGPLSVERVRQGSRRYEAALVARGMLAGEIKPASLHAGDFWGQVFAGSEP